MASKHRKEVEKMMVPVEKMIIDLSTLHEKVIGTGEEIGAQATKVDQQIDLYYEELHQLLQQQREELKRKLQEMHTQKKNAITLQLEQMNDVQAKLESAKELSDAMQMNQEILFVKKQVTNNVKRIIECYKELYTNPVEFATIKFVPVKQYSDHYCMMIVYSAGNYEVAGIPLQPLVRNKFDFKIIMKDHNNACCSKGGHHRYNQAREISFQ